MSLQVLEKKLQDTRYPVKRSGTTFVDCHGDKDELDVEYPTYLGYNLVGYATRLCYEEEENLLHRKVVKIDCLSTSTYKEWRKKVYKESKSALFMYRKNNFLLPEEDRKFLDAVSASKIYFYKKGGSDLEFFRKIAPDFYFENFSDENLKKYIEACQKWEAYFKGE